MNLYHKVSCGSSRYFRYPDEETFTRIKKFELDNQRRIRLNAVSCDLTMPHLSGIKLDFSDGFRSDRFVPETESCLYPKNYKE